MATTPGRTLKVAEEDERALARVLAGYVLSATAWLLFATFVGILLAYKFGAPEYGSGAWLISSRCTITCSVQPGAM
jgi:cytochrome c oxidase cbb3-type subunit 1